MNLSVHLESNNILSFRFYFHSKGDTLFGTRGIHCLKNPTTKNYNFNLKTTMPLSGLGSIFENLFIICNKRSYLWSRITEN